MNVIAGFCAECPKTKKELSEVGVVFVSVIPADAGIQAAEEE